MSYLSDSSSDLSSPPASPSPPPDFYPSPPSSQTLQGTSPAISETYSAERNETEKRAPQPKPRISRHVNLGMSPGRDQSNDLNMLISAIQNKRKIVVVAGAGISVSAGILKRVEDTDTVFPVPDFRSSHGLFKTLRKGHKLKASGKELFDASVYLDSTMTSSFHEMVRSLSGMAAAAQPSAFHHLLARLAKERRLMRLYTQNIDGIDASLPPLTTEVPLDFEAELFQGPDPPLCPKCCQEDSHRISAGQRSRGIGKLRPRIVLYNEHNPDEEAIGSVVRRDLRARPDALVVVGTSLKIPGVRRIVKEMCRVVQGRKDGIVIWINHDAAPVGRDFEQCWDLVVKGDCDEVAGLVGLKQWDDSGDDAPIKCPAPDTESLRKKYGSNIAVVVPASTATNQGEMIHSAPIAKLTNSGNKRSSLNEIPDRKKKGPSKPRRTSQNKKAPRQNQIGSNFRVSKPSKQGAPKGVKPLPCDGSISMAMCPLSPGEVRNNGPLSPGLVVPSTSCSPSWKDAEIIATPS
ncbi:hst4p protein [Uncinocarpus reesii 1704]|uniref:Hst4p protein n=1 Tax=Uncinocarpus reesii (strain UAMH 1704) TaxID=336963 RepID=C4JQS5_UNCRE|nr:hst4p protein [Uncinocarpus reesii 1704]EEP78561.1 hst4p protein [Uncinocarpus reesii 1704]